MPPPPASWTNPSSRPMPRLSKLVQTLPGRKINLILAPSVVFVEWSKQKPAEQDGHSVRRPEMVGRTVNEGYFLLPCLPSFHPSNKYPLLLVQSFVSNQGGIADRRKFKLCHVCFNYANISREFTLCNTHHYFC